MGQEGRPRARRRHGARSRDRRRDAVLRHVYILPNLFTTGSLFCGTLALVRVFEQRYDQACWLIIFAALLDSVDGLIARLTHTESRFGLHYDSLSDMVAFGVSPAALMLSFLHEGNPKIVTLPCILYIICGALRLARFNVQATGEESRNFSGLPIPAAAGALVSAYLVFRHYSGGWEAHLLPLLILGLSVLMVSTVPYPSFKSFSLKNRKPFDFLVGFVIILVVAHWISSIELLLLMVFLAYIGWGIGRHAMDRIRRFRETAEPPSEPMPVAENAHDTPPS